jgi:acetyltransferase-like isoleucine patch superfamily enzyme
MKKPIVLFGTGKIAEVILYYAEQECGFQVDAFVVDQAYVGAGEWKGKTVYALENLHEHIRPETHDAFVAIGYHNMNQVRAQKVEALQNLGFTLVSILPASANAPKDLKIGFNCFIMPPAILHPCVTIGNDVFIWSGAMVAHHSSIQDHCWITSSANIGGNCQIGEHSFLALNTTVSHGITIGKKCFLGANTLVTKNMEDGQVVIAESAKPIRLNSTQFLKFSSFSNL